MATNKVYLAIGEEATRGTGESSTVGFTPLVSPSIPTPVFDDRPRGEFRGADKVRGEDTIIRHSKSWEASLEFPVFTEAGTDKGMIGTFIKHFFGGSTSTQNGATGQYAHMIYPVPDPFATANLGTKALTLNTNLNEGDTMKNWPFVGGRVTSLTFNQEAGEPLIMSANMVGQFRDTTTGELGSVVMPAENLRTDFNNVTIYSGTITRTGSNPDYTDITFGSATTYTPDSISVTIENGMTDRIILNGKDYPDKTSMGKYKVTIEMTFDWADPSSGFSSVDDYNLWVASASSTNFAIFWDSGTQAGTGDNHSLILDIPIAQRMGGEPEYADDTDPKRTAKFEGLYDGTTTGYLIGLMLKNTATVV